ncbi:conserved hypothetical protein [Vibrio crassostreae]|nr:Exonuclease SbcC [Vibrio chagasii]CAK2868095.1 conserved hypothetical protein [Vibrio crassostreae]
MSLNEETTRQFEDFVIRSMAESTPINEISASVLQREFSESSYQDCALWLLQYKQELGVIVRVPQPAWFDEWLVQLSKFGQDMWPRLEDHLQQELQRTKEGEEKARTELNASLTDALSQVSKLEDQVQLLTQQVEALERENSNSAKSLQSVEKAHELVVTTFENAGKTLQEQCDKLTIECQSHTDTIKDLNKDLVEKDKLVNAAVQRAERAESERDEERERASASESQLGECKSELVDFKSQLTTLNDEHKKLKKNQSPDSKTLEKAIKKADDMKIEAKSLNDRLVSSESRNEQLVQQIVKQGEQLQKSSDRMMGASEAQHEAELETAELRGRMNALNPQEALEASEGALKSDCKG